MLLTIVFHAVWTAVVCEHFAVAADRSPNRGHANIFLESILNVPATSQNLRPCLPLALLLTVLYPGIVSDGDARHDDLGSSHLQ